MWIVSVPYGLHRCIQCRQVVAKGDLTPKYDELPADFRQRWEAHERSGAVEAAGVAASPG